MKAVHVVLCSLLLSSLAARAEEPAPSEDTLRATITRDFLTPFVERQHQRSRFSRAALPPMDYRVGTVRAALERDSRGEMFATFTVDQRFAALEWSTSAMSGCVYPKTGEIFVTRGDQTVAASFLLGKKGPNPPAGACRAEKLAAK